VVLRLLDKQTGRLDLKYLGMSPDILKRLQEQLQKPHGVLLVTGPTGSGKTTSLYAMLNYLNDRSRNMMTVEDPIEYYLDGIGQTQVNAKTNMTFAKGLRAILRQDPDIVMVGEIRDTETAQIAVQASLTGHLFLSTLHTNTAIGAVTRLRDMGIEPFLIASSLIAVMSQRLMRLLCSHCKQAYQVNQIEPLQLHFNELITLYSPQGCPACNLMGYRHRIGIYELVNVDNALRTMIHDSAGQHTLEAYAHQQTDTIQQNGIKRLLAGDTALEELLRVTREV
jgi:general secretion pathway protein E